MLNFQAQLLVDVDETHQWIFKADSEQWFYFIVFHMTDKQQTDRFFIFTKKHYKIYYKNKCLFAFSLFIIKIW